MRVGGKGVLAERKGEGRFMAVVGLVRGGLALRTWPCRSRRSPLSRRRLRDGCR